MRIEPEPPARPPDRAVEAAEESTLLDAARAGRRDAAERLAAATYRKLYAACCRMTGDPEAAADLTQETYRKAWQALPGFRGGCRFSTWLFRIAFTTHLKQLRRPRRIVPLDPVLAEVAADPDPGPEDATAERERAVRLRRAVATLPDDLRFAVTAHYWAETPIADLAAVEGITPVGLRKRLARAFRMLAAALEETSR
jgi:RNA polymerase sigma factor (sigma-70 family)